MSEEIAMKIKNRNPRLILIVLISVTILLAAIFLNPFSNEEEFITLNEFYDDIIDRNGDNKLNYEDNPIEWESYSIGDNITIRDKISDIYVIGNDIVTGTYIEIEYTGKYSNQMSIPALSSASVYYYEGDLTEEYQVGDYITLTNTIVLDETSGGAIVYSWEIVS